MGRPVGFVTDRHPKVARELDVEVLEVRKAQETLQLRLPDGRVVEAWLPEELAELANSGARTTAFLSEDDTVLGWFLPEHNIGARQDEPD